MINISMQIDEPIQSSKSNIIDNSAGVSIGIDFGTTNSVITYVNNKKIISIEDNGTDIIPSVIAFYKDGNIEYGQKVAKLESNEEVFVLRSFKRNIGKNYIYNIYGREWNNIEILSIYFAYIVSLVESQLNTKIKDAVITVPASFGDLERAEIKQAASMIGLNIKRLLNEPTAAALSYGLDNQSEGYYAVYDLGGGTFDVSILSMQKGIFKVIANDGDISLGGDDFDKIIQHKYQIQDILTARKIKEFLSNNSHYNYENITIQAADFAKDSEVIIKKTISIIQNAINAAHINATDLNGIILVGGATRMPFVKTFIVNNFSNANILNNLDPDKIVGIGAGIKAAGKNSGFETILLDIVPLSLGIETLGGIMEKIIYRNTPIPCSISQTFTTSHDNQTGIVINVLQGEREMAKDCRNIGNFILKNIPQMPAGMPKIEVKFSIDSDGILSVTAKENISNNEIEIDIKPMYNMDYQKMSDMLINAIENAKEDMNKKLLTQSITNAKNIITTIEYALNKDGDLLSEDELLKIEAHIQVLEDKISASNSRDEIEQSSKDLENITTPFMEDRVNRYLNKAIVGHSIKEF